MKKTKLIAEFIGVYTSDNKGWYVGSEISNAGLPFSVGIMGNGMYELPFATSWDWLMPVYKKMSVEINTLYKEQNEYLFTYFDLLKRAVRDVHIDDAYNYLIECIEYYNEIKINK